MSAITGIYQLDQEPAYIEHGTSMMLKLEKYPCDAVRTWHGERIFLGCRAQHITPESLHETLPYYDSERRLAITADAILDNREDLFEQLQVQFGKRKSITDSELILLGYDKWGLELPKHLVGDFSFMIWDEREQQLFGAKDFSGSRPLYYSHDQHSFAFCTVIEPLLTLPHVNKRLNEQWIAEFLAISTPVDTVDASITPYIHIHQVPPSHYILVHKGKVTVTRYSYLSSPGERLKLKSNEEYVEAFQEVFRKSVTSKLRTHRGVGAHLSGGLDSGAVVSFAVQGLKGENKPLHSFSYVPVTDFQDYTPKYLMSDERPFIQETVQHVGGIDPHYLDFEGRDSFSDIDPLLDILEMPYKFFENSFWLRGMFEKAKERNLGVLLSGARGNLSISWGPALEYHASLLKQMKWVRLVRALDQYSHKMGGARLRRLPEVAKAAFPVLDRMFPSRPAFVMPRLIDEQFARKSGVYDKLEHYGMDQTGWLSSHNMYELRTRHFEDVFHWNATSTLTSKLSLQHGVWQRDPTNDLRVIRYCLSVPEDQCVHEGWDRALVRRSTQHLLPDKIRLNHRIRGVQGADWLHRIIPNWSALMEELQQLSQDEHIFHYLNRSVIDRAMAKVKGDVRPELATDPDYRILMRSLIFYRFMKKYA